MSRFLQPASSAVQEGEEVKRRQEQETLDREAAGKKAEADAKRRQREAAHNDAVAAFQTLLAETVKDSSARWQVHSHHLLSTASAVCSHRLPLALVMPLSRAPAVL